MDVPYLFVYGTLRSDAGHPMHGALTARATLVGVAFAPGELYALREFVALVAREDARTTVKGEIYEIRSDAIDPLLATLDDYEGLSDPANDEYRRQVIAARLADGTTLRAWSYVLNRSAIGLRRIPSGDYKDSAPK